MPAPAKYIDPENLKNRPLNVGSGLARASVSILCSSKFIYLVLQTRLPNQLILAS